MDRATELALLEELAGLRAAGSAYLDEEVVLSPVERYGSAERFDRERRDIFRRLPLIAAHSSELAEPGAFLTRQLSGLPILLTRDRDNACHAFLNVCRHRGARLVGEASGCKNSFSCPYHAWTWSNRGELRGVPHEAQGFPQLDRAAYGLKRLPVLEQHGLVWVIADPAVDPATDIAAFLAPLGDELDWLQLDRLAIAESDSLSCAANWKILVEGGIEAYHFRVAHRDTIGPHFQDNLSSYAMFGPHMRSVLPRMSLDGMTDAPREQWAIREHANVLYSIFPANQFLVMQDHVAWIGQDPASEGETALRIATLVPAEELTPDRKAHWRRNHEITMTTLAEDFEIGVAVQAGIASGANDNLTFGRYEGALDSFNRKVEAALR